MGIRMAGVEAVKDLVKPPFANYDIVVYLGCGLFSLPFALHYGAQVFVETPSFVFEVRPEFVSTLITTLTMLFAVYIVGQILAYLASEFIEKPRTAFMEKLVQ
jgi:hypothetical protein